MASQVALKVAILGLSESSRREAPWGDPEWELWGLAWDAERHRMHRTFEMHEMALIEGFRSYYKPDYLQDLALQVNLYSADGAVKGSTVYPFDEVAKTIGAEYWCSSMAYMASLAIHEDAEEIGLFGIDMSDDGAYGYQKPNMEYLIGLARGRGITVHIPDSSPLCKYVDSPGFAYLGRYGRKKD